MSDGEALLTNHAQLRHGYLGPRKITGTDQVCALSARFPPDTEEVGLPILMA